MGTSAYGAAPGAHARRAAPRYGFEGANAYGAAAVLSSGTAIPL